MLVVERTGVGHAEADIGSVPLVPSPVDPVAHRLELAEEFGATATVDVAAIDSDEALIGAVQERTTGGVGPDVGIGAAGVGDAVRVGVQLPHKAGAYVEVGHYHHDDVVFDPGTLVQKELDVYGSLAYPPHHFETSIAILDRVRHRLPLEMLFNYSAAFADASAAYEKMERGEAFYATIHS